jgi:nucleoid DNA-binding protein
MSEKTLTRMDLSEAVFREVGLSRNESANLVEAVLQHMSDALVRGRDGEDLVLRHLLGARQVGPRRPQPQDRRRSADLARAAC